MTELSFFQNFDLAILNEVIGDFPTVCNIDPEILCMPEGRIDPLLVEVKTIFDSYGLLLPDGPFNLNIGAIRALERLCDAGLRHIYLSEHSCEASAPDKLKGLLNISATGNPQRIPLMGHDEYTIRFSDLVAVAEKKGYRTMRGSYCDFIRYDYTDRLHFILTSGSQKDEHEIIRHFIEDLYTSEYLIATRE
ncbi:MAG: hypothetical protein E4G96_00870 [Chrysiogenales bacterium]|nr:MAG: hypothetical protein E4G96_00870 [Chrysiogenales bacterium]